MSEDRPQALAEVALQIEGELAGTEYDATPDELAAIDEGVAGEAAGGKEVKAAFALFCKTSGSNIRSEPPRSSHQGVFRSQIPLYRWRRPVRPSSCVSL